MDTILFDLDGTLLPMVQDDFVRRYLQLLGGKAAAHGYAPQPLIESLWRGTGKMVKNDGAASNHRRFWDTFATDLGEDIRALEPVFNDFYAQEFNAARDATIENPGARALIDLLHEKGYALVLATNPLFPPAAIATRLSWIGLQPQDFVYITDYSNSYYCKPHPGYFQQILDKLGKQPQDCLMVGNSIGEDTGALALGIPLYLVTDCLEGEGDYSQLPHGSFADFIAYARQLPEI